MNIFKSLKQMFINQDKQQYIEISDPAYLRIGDYIKFKSIGIPSCDDKRFKVININTYINGDSCSPELVLQSESGQLIYLVIEEETDEDDEIERYIALSINMCPEHCTIKNDDFKKMTSAATLTIDTSNNSIKMLLVEKAKMYSQMFNKQEGSEINLNLQQDRHVTDGWISANLCDGNNVDEGSGEYTYDDTYINIYLSGDARTFTDTEVNNFCEECKSYVYESSDEKYAIELEEFEDDEFELNFTKYIELSEIAEILVQNPNL